MEANQSHLYWQCRRGMLELDILLQNFFKHCFNRLTEKEVSVFENLLQCSDDLLLEYLMGQTVAVDQGMNGLIQKIRSTPLH